MPIWDKYLNDAPQVESQTPADTLEKGEYPGEVINARVELREGTSTKSGRPYSFGDMSLQLKVLEGPMKGQTTWVRPSVTLPDETMADGSKMDDSMREKLTYFVQKFYDATGLGKRLDPSWRREEAPHPKKAGKTITKFYGKVLKKAHLEAIARSKEESEAFAKLMVGLTGIWSLAERTAEGKSGETVVQDLKGVEPITDANLRRWREKVSGGGATSSSPRSSVYGS